MKKFKMLGIFEDQRDANKKCRIHAVLIRNMGQQNSFSVGVEYDEDDDTYVLWLFKA